MNTRQVKKNAETMQAKTKPKLNAGESAKHCFPNLVDRLAENMPRRQFTFERRNRRKKFGIDFIPDSRDKKNFRYFDASVAEGQARIKPIPTTFNPWAIWKIRVEVLRTERELFARRRSRDRRTKNAPQHTKERKSLPDAILQLVNFDVSRHPQLLVSAADA